MAVTLTMYEYIRICTHVDVSITVWRSGRGGDNVEVTLHQIDRGLVTASSNGYCALHLGHVNTQHLCHRLEDQNIF